jgi:DNA-binding transcriptional regulator YiaG
MKKKYKSEILGVCHEMMKDMYEDGIVDKTKMDEFDKMCLVPAPKTPKKRGGSRKGKALTSTRNT